MRTVILGTGNVAWHLAHALKKSGIDLKQIYGRNIAELKNLQDATGINVSSTHLEKADLYLLCVSDSALEEVSVLITDPNVLVAHTSGSLPIEVLKGKYRKACFYPMQTFSKQATLDYSQIPFFIDAPLDKDFELLQRMALGISSHVARTTFTQRQYLHVSAVLCSNFVNHLFTLTKELCSAHALDFSHFLPLIDQTVKKIHTLDPLQAQTGPAVRRDHLVLARHEALLEGHLLELYRILSQSIERTHYGNSSLQTP